VGQVLVIGVVNGTIYALFAVGVALVYRGARTINFAQGEMATVSLFAAWWFVADRGLPWIIGALVALVVAGGLGVGFQWLVVRHLARADRVMVAVATIGLLSVILALEYQLFSASPRSLRGPIEGLGIKLFGIYVSPTQSLSIGVVVLVGLGLGVLLRRTDFGLGVLAAAQDSDGARLMGVPVRRVSLFVWGTGAAVAALAALLVVPTIGTFTPGFATELFVKGIVAAVIGGLASPNGAIAGGYALGLTESAARRLFASATVPGFELIVLFAIVLAALLFRPTGLVATARTRGAA
jgi:branched-chain amino acid transport system permease protein